MAAVVRVKVRAIWLSSFMGPTLFSWMRCDHAWVAVGGGIRTVGTEFAARLIRR
jgi:hypothetical protein